MKIGLIKETKIPINKKVACLQDISDLEEHVEMVFMPTKG